MFPMRWYITVCIETCQRDGSFGLLEMRWYITVCSETCQRREHWKSRKWGFLSRWKRHIVQARLRAQLGDRSKYSGERRRRSVVVASIGLSGKFLGIDYAMLPKCEWNQKQKHKKQPFSDVSASHLSLVLRHVWFQAEAWIRHTTSPTPPSPARAVASPKE